MRNPVSRLYELLRSIRLAYALIIALGLFGVVGGLVPQRGDSSLVAPGHPVVARIVAWISPASVFTGPAFLLVAALFSVNLTLCSFHRLTTQLALPRGKRRHGPDLLHVGLIVLIVGAAWSARSATETRYTLAEGEEASLPGGEILTLRAFSFERYPDGRPKSWSSRIDLDSKGARRISDFDLRVNRPLRYGGYALYQTGYDETPVVALRGSGLALPETLLQGSRLTGELGSIVFMAPDPDAEPGTRRFVFLADAEGGRKVVRAGIGDPVGEFTLHDASSVFSSTIKVRSDPGFPLVLAGLLLVALGTVITYIVKLRESKP
ncbi:MAG: cytochrome c biogenesis protein ResB [Spirochaetia bacterium]|nr:cytochrome c biogenesis protein ResB [Spirochaetia bacterium]